MIVILVVITFVCMGLILQGNPNMIVRNEFREALEEVGFVESDTEILGR